MRNIRKFGNALKGDNKLVYKLFDYPSMFQKGNKYGGHNKNIQPLCLKCNLRKHARVVKYIVN
jgi:hypothetical protein